MEPKILRLVNSVSVDVCEVTMLVLGMFHLLIAMFVPYQRWSSKGAGHPGHCNTDLIVNILSNFKNGSWF